MRIFDVNVAVAALREDHAHHEPALAFLDAATRGERPFSLPPLVASGVVRLATHPRIFTEPTELADALAFVDAIRSRPSHVELDERRAWPAFLRICAQHDARGNRVPDAYVAAVSIVNGASLVSADRGLARYRELTVERPPGM